MGIIEHQNFMRDQIHQIEVDKWLYGEQIGRDPGNEYVMWWIKTHAAQYRAEWEAEHKE